MTQRTHPIGTRLTAEVLDVSAGGTPTRPRCVLAQANGEGFVLMGTDHAIAPAAGQRVIMEFTAGGQFGGFWKIISLAAEAPPGDSKPKTPNPQTDS